MGQKERRNEPRLDLKFNVYGANGYLGYTRNVSLNGCYLETVYKIKKKTLDISFELPDSLQIVNTKCRIAWNRGICSGLRFIMDDENRKIHSQFINIWSNLAE